MAEPRRPGGAPPRRFRPARLLMPLLFALVFGMVLLEAVPSLGTWVAGLTEPRGRVEAREICATAALSAAREPAFARLIERGEAHQTRGGYYVDGVVVGEKGEDGGEVHYGFSCYVDAQGEVVGTDKQPR